MLGQPLHSCSPRSHPPAEPGSLSCPWKWAERSPQPRATLHGSSPNLWSSLNLYFLHLAPLCAARRNPSALAHSKELITPGTGAAQSILLRSVQIEAMGGLDGPVPRGRAQTVGLSSRSQPRASWHCAPGPGASRAQSCARRARWTRCEECGAAPGRGLAGLAGGFTAPHTRGVLEQRAELRLCCLKAAAELHCSPARRGTVLHAHAESSARSSKRNRALRSPFLAVALLAALRNCFGGRAGEA